MVARCTPSIMAINSWVSGMSPLLIKSLHASYEQHLRESTERRVQGFVR